MPFRSTGLFRLGVIINCRNSCSFSTIAQRGGHQHSLQDVLSGWVNSLCPARESLQQSHSVRQRPLAHLFCNTTLCARRAYASRPVSPGVKRIRLGYEPELPHPVKIVRESGLPPPPPPHLELGPPNPEDFIPHSKVKLVQHGFLVTWIVAFLLVKVSILQWNIKRKSQNHDDDDDDDDEASSTEKKIQHASSGEQYDDNDVFVVVAPDDTQLSDNYAPPDFGKKNVPAPNRIFSIMGNHFVTSPSFIYPIPGTWSTQFRPWTAFTHTLLHASVFHLACCYISLKCFVQPMVFWYGPAKFVGLFFAGGGLATFLHSTTERLINPAAKMTMEETTMKTKKVIMSYHQRSVGSSGAIISLGIRLYPGRGPFTIIPFS